MNCAFVRIENPCVGGSIPPQATNIHAPQRPFRVLGRFYISLAISTIRPNIAAIGVVISI
jgi:hypothetical protein